ncbi:MAG: hypothetical protein RMA76_02545 [Deltaproteobacteria bacterium]|jgi:hypothetical protein
MMLRASSVLLSLLLCACAQEIVVSNDGGTSDRDAGEGARDGGHADAGTIDGGARDGGTRDGGGAPRDGGSVRDAGTPTGPLTWGQAILPTNSRGVNVIWGRSAAEVYAGAGLYLLRFTPDDGWTRVWNSPSNFDIVGIGGTTSRLFVADRGGLHVFDGDPETTTPDYYSFPQTQQVEALLVRNANEAYLTITQFNGRALLRFDGTELRPLFQPNDVSTLTSLDEVDGTIYMGANGHLYRVATGVVSEETVAWPAHWQEIDQLMFEFHGVAKIGARVFAVGDDDMIFERGQDDTWRLVRGNGAPSMALEDVASFGNYGVAVGQPGPDNRPFRVFDGTGWTNQAGPDAVLYTVWAAGPNTWFAGGYVSIDGIILHGTR